MRVLDRLLHEQKKTGLFTISAYIDEEEPNELILVFAAYYKFPHWHVNKKCGWSCEYQINADIQRLFNTNEARRAKQDDDV